MNLASTLRRIPSFSTLACIFTSSPTCCLLSGRQAVPPTSVTSWAAHGARPWRSAWPWLSSRRRWVSSYSIAARRSLNGGTAPCGNWPTAGLALMSRSNSDYPWCSSSCITHIPPHTPSNTHTAVLLQTLLQPATRVSRFLKQEAAKLSHKGPDSQYPRLCCALTACCIFLVLCCVGCFFFPLTFSKSKTHS